MKTIIAATDFSSNAHNAMLYAGALAAGMKAKIILFNAFSLPFHASNTLLTPAGVDELLQANQERLEKMALQLSLQFGIAVGAQTQYASLTDALDEMVPQLKADLVVMGVHATDWSDRLFGNTTTAVIKGAAYPVLIVPETATFSGIKKILYAFDATYLADENKLTLLQELASRFGAEVQVFHVDYPGTAAIYNKETADNVHPVVEVALSEVEHDYKEVEAEDRIEGIEKGIEAYKADLLVMVPHRLNIWESLLNQSTTRAMALRAQLPLLLLPNTYGENLS